MFKTNTVFILGAGVSVPFGFPSGDRLLRILTGSVSRQVNDVDCSVNGDHRNLRRLLETIPTDAKYVSEFIDKLATSSTPSIDTWLAQNLDYMDFGKTAIAAVIANAENNASYHSYEPDDWYKWLINKMLSDTKTIEQFLDNRVSFITFNYDRMLEWRLGDFINNFYVVEQKVKDAAVEHLFKRIVHVHGHLAFNNYTELKSNIRGIALDSVSSSLRGGAEQRKQYTLYGRRAQEQSKSIRIIGETATNDHEYSYLSLIEGADKIIFLGFGYDDRNLEVLRLKRKVNTLLSKSFATDWELPVIGSAYGMGKAQIRDAEAAIHSNILLGEKTLSCVPFCNEYVSTVVA